MFKREILFLGSVVSEERYKPDQSKIAPVLPLKETLPKTISDVRKLMGFLNCYRRQGQQSLPKSWGDGAGQLMWKHSL